MSCAVVDIMFICLYVYMFICLRVDISMMIGLVICYTSHILEYDRRNPELVV